MSFKMFPRVENVNVYEMLSLERRYSSITTLVASVNGSDYGIKIEYTPRFNSVEISVFKLRRFVSALTLLNVPENEDYEWVVSVEIGMGYERCGVALSHGSIATIIPLIPDDADVSQMITEMIEFVAKIFKSI